VKASDPQRRYRAFSLVEVVVAIGVAAVSVVSVIALYRPIVAGVGEVRAMDEADRAVRAIEEAWRARDQAGRQAWLDASVRLFASRDGRVVAPSGDAAWDVFGATAATRDAARYYEAFFVRNETLSPAVADPAAVHIVLHLAWPAHTSGGVRVTVPAEQQHRFVSLVLRR
jgi:type II secretory pathway pseudopilin PulG